MKDAIDLFGRTCDLPLAVGVLGLDQTNLLPLAAAVDPLRAANRKAEKELFRWTYLTPEGQPVQTPAGLPIAGPALSAAPPLDLLIVVASFRVEAQSTPALHSQLRRLARAGAVIIGVDGGPWLLADSGILDGLPATTHWEDLDRFAARFPRVQMVRDRFRIAGRIITTGGASPCLDLMLDLIGRLFGRDLPTRVASAFIYDPIHAADAPQRLVQTAALAKRAPVVARAIAILENELDAPPDIDTLAHRLGTSRRRLEQRFRAAIGQSPYRFALSLRLAEARRLATDTVLSVQDIALATGFGSQASFARAFQSAFGQSVRDLRRSRGH